MLTYRQNGEKARYIMYKDYYFSSVKEAAESYGCTEKEIIEDFDSEVKEDGIVVITWEEF